MLRIKSGNTVAFEIACYDQDDNLLTNLSATTEIIFKIIMDESNAITKKKSLGEITVDDPNQGYLTIPLSSDDTKDYSGICYIAIELRWASSTEEMNLFVDDEETDKIGIKADIITS